MARTIRNKRDTRGYRNKDRTIVRVSSDETRAVRRLRRRAENAEVQGYRPGKQAIRASRRGYWYA